MWWIAVIAATAAVRYMVGVHWDSPGIGSLVGFAVDVVVSFPRIIGEVAEGAIDCID